MFNDKSFHSELNEDNDASSIQDLSPKPPTIWEQILEEADEGRRTYQQIKDSNTTPRPNLPQHYGPLEYLDQTVFPVLLPALESVLTRARRWNVLRIQKSSFNGIDQLAEYLWNSNPRYKERAENWTTIFKIPFVIQYLEENPRPFYPMSWLWSYEKAALIIQCAVRAFLVRRRDDVQEMRQFWKALKQERKEERDRRAAEELKEVEAARLRLYEEDFYGGEEYVVEEIYDSDSNSSSIISEVVQLQEPAYDRQASVHMARRESSMMSRRTVRSSYQLEPNYNRTDSKTTHFSMDQLHNVMRRVSMSVNTMMLKGHDDSTTDNDKEEDELE